MWESVRIFASKRSRRTALLVAAAVVVAMVGVSLLINRRLPWLTNPDAVRTWIRSFGVFAPAVFVGLQALQVVIAPVPGHVMALVSGYLFGTYWGTLYSVGGAVIGSYVAFTLSRRFGRPFVESVIHAETLEEFDDLTHDHGLLALFLVFLVPGLPDDVICFTAGLTDLRIHHMVAVAVIGRLPGFFLINLAGAQFAAARHWLALAVLGVIGLLTLLAYLYRARLLALLREEA